MNGADKAIRWSTIIAVVVVAGLPRASATSTPSTSSATTAGPAA